MRTVLGVASAAVSIAMVALIIYALVRNPRWGAGNARVLALSVVIPFSAVLLFAGGLLLLG